MSGFLSSMVGATYAPPVANAAVSFDGTGDLYSAASLSTTATDSKYLTIAFTWFHESGANSRNQHFMTARLGTANGENGWEVCIQSGRFRYSSYDNSGASTDMVYGDYEGPTENAYNQIVAYIDHTSFANCKYYLNGVDRTSSLLNGGAIGAVNLGNNNINWGTTNANIRIGVQNATAGYNSGFSDFLGRISQIYVHNASGAPNISKYWNTTTNLPLDLGTNGTATGLAQPLIYHYGTTATFPTNNGTGFNAYTLTATGDIASAEGPTYGTYVASWMDWTGATDGTTVTYTGTSTPARRSNRVAMVDSTNGFHLYESDALSGGVPSKFATKPFTISGTTVTLGTSFITDYNPEYVGGINASSVKVNTGRTISTMYASLAYHTWNGSSWASSSTVSAVTLPKDINLLLNVGTDKVINVSTNYMYTDPNTVIQLYTFSGATATLQTSVNLNGAMAQPYKIDDNTIVLFYCLTAGTQYWKFRVLTISGNSLSLGSEQTGFDDTAIYFNNYRGNKGGRAAGNNLVFGSYNSDGSVLYLYPAQVSGGTVTPGTRANLTYPTGYNRIQHCEFYPLDGTHFLCYGLFYKSAATAEQILAVKVVKNTAGTMSQTDWVSLDTTTSTEFPIRDTLIVSEYISDTKVLVQWGKNNDWKFKVLSST